MFLFDLGKVVQTHGVVAEIDAADVYMALERHRSGDFGDLSPEDIRQNKEAIKNGERILSSYRSANGVKFWIITEWDRSYTTVLLPGEY